MNRRLGSLALAAALVLVLAPAVVVAAGIGLGAWVPSGGNAGKSNAPAGPGPAQEQPVVTYYEFLSEVRAGVVLEVMQAGRELFVSTNSRAYTVAIEGVAPDVAGDVAQAAAEGGVPPPPVRVEGGPPIRQSWPEFLETVATARVVDVLHQGDILVVTGELGSYEVAIPPDVDDVLGEIEAAAEAAGVAPPFYSKAP